MTNHAAEELPVFKTETTWTLQIQGVDDMIGRLGKVLADSLLQALRSLGEQPPFGLSSHRHAMQPVNDVARPHEASGSSAARSKEGPGEYDAAHKLISVRTVAGMLGVSQRQVWKLVASGRLPAPLRLGRSVRWRADEIRSWIDAGCPSQDRWTRGESLKYGAKSPNT